MLVPLLVLIILIIAFGGAFVGHSVLFLLFLLLLLAFFL